MAEVGSAGPANGMPAAGEPDGRLLHLMARVSGILAALASDIRRRPGVARVLHECNVSGDEHVSNFEAYLEVHADSGSYVCLWFDLGCHVEAGWSVGASVLAAGAVGAPQEVLERHPETACADVATVEHAALAAIEWLVAQADRLEHLGDRP